VKVRSAMRPTISGRVRARFSVSVLAPFLLVAASASAVVVGVVDLAPSDLAVLLPRVVVVHVVVPAGLHVGLSATSSVLLLLLLRLSLLLLLRLSLLLLLRLLLMLLLLRLTLLSRVTALLVMLSGAYDLLFSDAREAN
jgi:hypothetical protein